jgi:hypothetical protein
MKGSITFIFSGNANDRRVYISEEGELDSGDLQIIASVIEEDFELKKWIASGEIKLTPSDPTGIRQLHSHWSN